MLCFLLSRLVQNEPDRLAFASGYIINTKSSEFATLFCWTRKAAPLKEKTVVRTWARSRIFKRFSQVLARIWQLLRVFV